MPPFVDEVKTPQVLFFLSTTTTALREIQHGFLLSVRESTIVK
jgi:hypothetical protein